ncbi:LLM class flavin-dependent oxidoreductase [Intrasporangium calvum]|uniref:Luciferase family oxidoreductase, group 1 n=1 Tax=Intrasporangium calvum (strain ATCC 23552 / DSM 43043 / JCM 3097 / NBRC 12989 / NCIMB 10167 / NRRL B-3866 / 7 KIP) TaxID=710696 RepID=E6SEC6_INTC7|nr:LLM class flavin-dependent oxidoreductase [Intrasporangium calvum]ADU49803.1 luciferase family oxidoreductase, group 1 [Intrasporangium calvum DSM 43043]AXG14659.1 LLM class flavin-dependent oxidoreductase [Intrasporangium calvum]
MTSPRAQLNVLDLVPIAEGGSAAEAIAQTVDLARHAERWGYGRYWMAEHHNFRGVASSSTAVLIGHVAAHTSTIRVGAGGIMLPNHAPYVVAEQFGTLATMYPGRIDLGLGRAPGTDPATARALRRNEVAAMNFAAEVEEVQGYLGDPEPGASVRAIPGEGTHVPLWILGSSHGGAQVAAALGLPYSFASHFAPAALMSALDVYRRGFQASPLPGGLDAPRTMAGANVMVADTQAEAERLFTSVLERFRGIVTNQRSGLRPPAGSSPVQLLASWSPAERSAVAEMTRVSFVGTPADVRGQLADFTRATGVDEVIVTCGAFDPEARKRSLELLADAWQ